MMRSGSTRIASVTRISAGADISAQSFHGSRPGLLGPGRIGEIGPLPMNGDSTAQTSLLLRRIGQGDADASAELLPIVYDELHRVAARLMRGQKGDHTLQATALIHEAYMRLVGPKEAGYEDRAHFLRVAAAAMRCVLIDHARAEKAQKRGGGMLPITFHEEWIGSEEDASHRLLVVHEGLQELAKVKQELADVVELRFFGGLQNGEIAELLGVSLRSVERSWQFARAWLQQYFGQDSGDAT